MVKKPETRLQQRIQERLRQTFPKIYIRKIHGGPFMPAGMPDLICCVFGHFIGLEVKIPGQQRSKLQLRESEEIYHAGGSCVQVTSPDEAVDAIAFALRARGVALD